MLEKDIQMQKSEEVNLLKINRLKIVLAELEISQAELAEKIGKSKVTVSRICNNKTQPSLELLWQISLELGVDIRELLYRSIPKEK